MSFRPAIILSVLLCAVMLGAMQTTPSGSSQAATSQANMANTAQNAQFRRFNSADEARATEGDIKRMRALVSQMETNLAFVDSTQSPLKHQFQLEIDAWRILLDQMERRAQANSR
jgi:ABC-type Fe3+-siderophore transport system permease subunit